jgi:hypothetical protein
MRAKALSHLRKFCTHTAPPVRAAAVAGLGSAVLQTPSEKPAPNVQAGDLEKELRAALEDGSSGVRGAAAQVIFQYFESRWPSGHSTYFKDGGGRAGPQP